MPYNNSQIPKDLQTFNIFMQIILHANKDNEHIQIPISQIILTLFIFSQYGFMLVLFVLSLVAGS